jgi:hypothetical protein
MGMGYVLVESGRGMFVVVDGMGCLCHQAKSLDAGFVVSDHAIAFGVLVVGCHPWRMG